MRTTCSGGFSILISKDSLAAIILASMYAARRSAGVCPVFCQVGSICMPIKSRVAESMMLVVFIRGVKTKALCVATRAILARSVLSRAATADRRA